MQLETLKNLLLDPTKLVAKIQSLRPEDTDDFDSIQPENHDVMDEQIRKKREIKYDTEKTDDNGDPIMKTVHEEVTRIPSSIEKTIINWSVTMAAGVPVKPIPVIIGGADEVMAAMVEHELTANKVEFKDKQILRLLGTYKRCAEVWFSEKCAPEYWGELGTFPTRMRMMILSLESGDVLFPLFDNTGDLIALTREYKVESEDGEKKVDMFDVFTSENRFTYSKDDTGWVLDAVVAANYMGKMQVIYYQQDRTEYADITPKRKRLETLQSDIGDQNLATGSPIIVASKLLGLGKRGETGKVFETDEGGKVEILEAAGAPESLKLEWDNLKKDIWAETQTPDTSIFDSVGTGDIPGITIKLRFLPATLKALSKQSGEWGMGIQRRYNFLKAACAVINPKVVKSVGMSITPKFGIYLPTNESEIIANVVSMVNAGLMSKETAVKQLSFTDDPEAEYEKIKAEQAEAAKLIQPVTQLTKTA